MLKTTLSAAIMALSAGLAHAGTWKVTVTNNMKEELLAPILITSAANDGEIFKMGYVTPEAEEQILTGDPARLAARIGADAMIGAGTDGPPGVLLAPGKSVSFEIKTDATSVRVLAMVAPSLVPDNYVTGVVDLQGGNIVEAGLMRYDLGHDERTMMIEPARDAMGMNDAVASIRFEKAM